MSIQTHHVQTARSALADHTREQLLSVAERLYAEHGIAAVSNRQVARAAGSANNSAVAYHVGTKADLIAAISRRHTTRIGRQVRSMAESVQGSDDPRDHVACLVRPYTDHLATLEPPSWFARFTAQVASDPAYGGPWAFDAEAEEALHLSYARVWSLVPPLPAAVTQLRADIIGGIVIHTCAEQERSAAAGRTVDWTVIGIGLVDAVTGVVLAPDNTGS